MDERGVGCGGVFTGVVSGPFASGEQRLTRLLRRANSRSMVRRVLVLLGAATVLLACDGGARRAGGPSGSTLRADGGGGSSDGGATTSDSGGAVVHADASDSMRLDAAADAGSTSFPDATSPDATAADAQPQVLRTIAAIQDPSDPGAPVAGCTQVGTVTTGQCARAEIRGVVVTAVEGFITRDLRAMWVQDPGDGDGRFAGVKVVYRTNTPVPAVGQVVDVDGEVVEFQGNTQIRFATVTPTGGTGTITPRVISPPGLISRSSPASAGEYEGTLVRILNVTVEQACFEDTLQRDFGYWTVTGDVQLGIAFQYGYNGSPRPGTVMCLDAGGNPTGLCTCAARSRPNDTRRVGDTFQSITGVMDYAFDTHVLQPRDANDLVR